MTRPVVPAGTDGAFDTGGAACSSSFAAFWSDAADCWIAAMLKVSYNFV